ncbi:hypothetical protein AGMMS50267_05120 [Spirochaetia bacterium]|nr:hypothetical protein AGMMS50267_05120 [Spirochaetia bacterium]
MITTTQAQEWSNEYHVIAKNKTSGTYYWARTRTDGATPTVTVEAPSGTYDVLLVAGIQREDHSAAGLILGTGYIQNKVVTVGTNNVTITCRPVDYSITILSPEIEIGVGTTEYELMIDSKNPLYIIVPANYGMWNYVYPKPTAFSGFSGTLKSSSSPTATKRVAKYEFSNVGLDETKNTCIGIAAVDTNPFDDGSHWNCHGFGSGWFFGETAAGSRNLPIPEALRKKYILELNTVWKKTNLTVTVQWAD